MALHKDFPHSPHAILDPAGVADYRSVIGYFAQTIMKDLRLVSGYDVLYGKVKATLSRRKASSTASLATANWSYGLPPSWRIAVMWSLLRRTT